MPTCRHACISWVGVYIQAWANPRHKLVQASAYLHPHSRRINGGQLALTRVGGRGGGQQAVGRSMRGAHVGGGKLAKGLGLAMDCGHSFKSAAPKHTPVVPLLAPCGTRGSWIHKAWRPTWRLNWAVVSPAGAHSIRFKDVLWAPDCCKYQQSCSVTFPGPESRRFFYAS